MMYHNVRSFAIPCLCAILAMGTSCGQKNRISNVSKISIYFVDWSLTTYTRLSCDDLKSARTPIVISEPYQIEEFVTAFESARLDEKSEFDGLDVRICCVLEDSAGSLIAEISFSPTSMMQVDDKVYTTDESLFQHVLSHLPQGYLET